MKLLLATFCALFLTVMGSFAQVYEVGVTGTVTQESTYPDGETSKLQVQAANATLLLQSYNLNVKDYQLVFNSAGTLAASKRGTNQQTQIAILNQQAAAGDGKKLQEVEYYTVSFQPGGGIFSNMTGSATGTRTFNRSGFITKGAVAMIAVGTVGDSSQRPVVKINFAIKKQIKPVN